MEERHARCTDPLGKRGLMSKQVVIGYHGRCFDGMASAAVLTHLLQELEPGPLTFTYRGLDHQPGGSHVPAAMLSGEINAVVDFRYTSSDKLTWWFDHHVSGVHDHELAHLRADQSGRKFFDPAYGSCCKLIADVARERFGCAIAPQAELIRWADIIDAARFPDATTAVELRGPA